MIRNILFDMGNVIVHYDPPFFSRCFCSSPEDAQELTENIFYTPEWERLDEDTITLQEFDAVNRTRIRPALHKAAHDVLYHWYENLPVYTGMEELIAKLKSCGLRLFVCSNAGVQFHTYAPHIPAFRYMEALVISADLHCCKPKPGIFRHILDTYRLAPSQCLFIDDVERNVRGAEALGIHGYRYDGNLARLRGYLKDQRVVPADFIL